MQELLHNYYYKQLPYFSLPILRQQPTQILFFHPPILSFPSKTINPADSTQCPPSLDT